MMSDQATPPENPTVGRGQEFDYWRRTTGFFLAPAVALIIWLTPFPNLSAEAHRLAGVASLVIIYWITEAIPIPATALLGVSLAVLLGVAPAKNILTAFGDQIIFLFIGSFMLARAMQRQGLDQRIAYALLAHPWVGGNTYRTLWAVGLTAWLLSMWISNTAAVAMLFPVVLAIAQETGRIASRQTSGSGELPPRHYTTALLLMLAFAGSVGGIATPVGTPPNLIGIALIAEGLQVRITFFRWMMFALPLAVLLLLVIFGTMLLL
ncbi:MAG TPA: SLC13 family permease, partial [Terriglobales bacterium]|nr:SLC13 family permease [Terriglobales bacterium]